MSRLFSVLQILRRLWGTLRSTRVNPGCCHGCCQFSSLLRTPKSKVVEYDRTIPRFRGVCLCERDLDTRLSEIAVSRMRRPQHCPNFRTFVHRRTRDTALMISRRLSAARRLRSQHSRKRTRDVHSLGSRVPFESTEVRRLRRRTACMQNQGFAVFPNCAVRSAVMPESLLRMRWPRKTSGDYGVRSLGASRNTPPLFGEKRISREAGPSF